MDNNNKFEQFDFNGIMIDNIYDPKKLEEEKTTSIKTRDNKAYDDIKKNNKAKKEEAIEEKKYIPVLKEKKDKIDVSTQTDKSNLDDDDESSDENIYYVHSYINKKKKREVNDDEE